MHLLSPFLFPSVSLHLSLSIPSAQHDGVNAWIEGTGTTFDVRKGPDYKKNKEKAPSLESMADIVAVEVFRTDRKVKDMGKHYAIPPEWFQEDDGTPIDGEAEEKETGVPLFFILNCMVPNYSPPNPVWGKAKTDGEGYSVIFIYRLKKEIRDDLKKDKPEIPAASLLRKFINAPNMESPFRHRFKGIARITNLEDPNLSFNSVVKKLVKGYNATPFIVRKTLSCFRGKNYFECGMDVHNFSYMALVGLAGVREKVKTVVFDMAVVIQGEPNEELPERILASATCFRIDVNQVPAFPLEYPKEES